MDVRWVSLGRLDAALGLLHRGAGFKTGVEASHDKIAGLAADARGIRRIAPALQQLGEIHIGCRNRRRERDACRRRIGLTGGSLGDSGAQRSAVLSPQVEIIIEVDETGHEPVPVAVRRQSDALCDARVTSRRRRIDARHERGSGTFSLRNPHLNTSRGLFDGRRLIQCRSEEHTSELQSPMRISYAVLCLKKKTIYSVSIDYKRN